MDAAEAAARKGKVVLAADDQAENIMMLEALIEGQGFTFFGVSSGAECLSLAQRVSPKLILLDVQMPEMDGFETCRRLRAIFPLKFVPVAFLTARKSAADVQACMRAGGNDFIVKPFDPERLTQRVLHWTSRRAPSAA
ncbi:MAG TPA: response regulator [Caulobacteraceae bacterium]|jgi:CheY-like chemotaxis protein